MIVQPIPAGDYLRLRREAAGLSIDDVALFVAPDDSAIGAVAGQLRLVELGEQVPPAPFVDRLHEAFRFDRRMFDLLVFIAIEIRVCRSCGCSDLCRCKPEGSGDCVWSTEHPDLCTECTHRAAAIAPALPFPTA